jgi:two-component system chemotaxis response regulator CheB
MIRVLIVDDSPTSAQLLNELFLSADDFEVVGCASTGHEALALCARLQPDIVSMDVLMSDQNGFEVTRQIMAQYPVPIVIVSAEPEDQNNSLTFRALEAGALGALNKPRITTSSEWPATGRSCSSPSAPWRVSRWYVVAPVAHHLVPSPCPSRLRWW